MQHIGSFYRHRLFGSSIPFTVYRLALPFTKPRDNPQNFENSINSFADKSGTDVVCCKFTVICFRLLSLTAFATALLFPNRRGLISTKWFALIRYYLNHSPSESLSIIITLSGGNSIFIFRLLCDLAAASRASWVVYCS